MKSNSRWKDTTKMYLKWFLLTFISYSVLHVLFALAFELGEPIGFLVIFFPIPIVYGILGFFQARLMHLHKERFYWILQALLTMVIYYYLSDHLQNLYQVRKVFGLVNLIPAFIAGGILGSLQFYILRKATTKAMWWIYASIFTCGLGYVFGWELLSMIGKETYHVTPNLIIVGVINAALTGIVYCLSISESYSQGESQDFSPTK